ncbi:MAG: flippase-like domain-containing protein [Bacteroidaceae bacterium]|nr:flippase-like domain-containing protein [Bacteroidaceae bacterium]
MTLNLKKTLEIGLSFLLAAIILWWIYRDFPFSSVGHVLRHDIDWGWMLLSLLFGIFPQVLRGIRWRQALEPLGERPRYRHCISAVYMSFAASLVIPRIGEISRCATLHKTDGTPFSTALGTVVTERIIDSLLVLLIIGITFLFEIPAFYRFFQSIGLNADSFFSTFSITGIIITIACACAVIAGGLYLAHRLRTAHGIKDTLARFGKGVASVRHVRSLPLYLLNTVLIWVCYFLHFYLAFYAFDFTSALGVHAGLLAFCMITLAVLVPTPNGAGPWHFAVKVVLLQFGVGMENAILFALIAHALQTLLVVLLGLYGLLTISMGKHTKHTQFQ